MSSASSSRATYIPRSYLASLPPDSEISMEALAAEQDRLADEAREAMPYAFDECSYGRGYVRQSVWSCSDCGGKGVCYGCSISCHAEHQLVELWARRHFRCDCPTTCTQPEPPTTASGVATSKRRRCALNPPQIQPAEDNAENRYNRNFKGEFCRCERVYDPLAETEGMLCCIGCEDWFHESCLNLRPRQSPPPTADPPVIPYPQPDQPAPETAPSSRQVEPPAGTQETVEDDEEAGVLIPSDSYDCLICAECVKAHPALSSRAGKEGWMMIIPTETGELEVIGRAQKSADEKDGSQRVGLEGDSQKAEFGVVAGSNKRAFEEVDDVSVKRAKLDLSSLPSRGEGDVFLAYGEGDKLKNELDADTIKSLPFPLVDEEIYEPPKDDNEEETLDEVTARMVDTLPRAQAIEAVHGYQRLKDRLQTMLASHALDGSVVSKDDIEAMFRELKGRAN